MKKFALLSLLLCFSFLVKAADIPDIVNSKKRFTREQCVANALNDCVNTICPNSPDINCAENCKDDAQNKCQGMMEE